MSYLYIISNLFAWFCGFFFFFCYCKGHHFFIIVIVVKCFEIVVESKEIPQNVDRKSLDIVVLFNIVISHHVLDVDLKQA